MKYLNASLLVIVLMFTACNQNGSEDAASLPVNDDIRGLVYDGLRPGDRDGPCAGLFEVTLGDGQVICTHGPDHAPPGVDARFAPRTRSLGTLSTETVPCIGDGVSGNRVQAVYAVAEDQTNRYAEVAPLIRGWAAGVDRVFADSAAQVGGERHVRFVTGADCELDVLEVVLPAVGDDSVLDTMRAMIDLGYDDPSRKYLIWMDAARYCGIAQIFSDDRAGQDNLHNGDRPMYARVDSACWDSATAASHELVHVLGGVQPSAPHASANYHCLDEEDALCYKDSVDVELSYDCPKENIGYLDCNHDDYYHTHPPANSYLDNHWNVADSSFLHSGSVTDPGDPEPEPEPTNRAPVVKAGADITVGLGESAQLFGSVTDDGLPSADVIIAWRALSGPGTVTFDDAAAPSTTASFSVAGTYVLELSASDGDLSASDTVSVVVNSAMTTAVYSANLNKRHPSRSFELTTGQGLSRAVLSFDSKRGKRDSGSLTLELYDASGSLLGAASGSSPVTLESELSGGAYRYEVTGSSTSFELEVSYPQP